MNNQLIYFEYLKPAFTNSLTEHSTVKFEQECHFARQLVEKNKDLKALLRSNPKTIEDAILNIANTDISLNPVTALAYLVPRKGTCCLDISYRGLYAAACRSGSITTLQARVVKETDNFNLNGIYEPPTHTLDPFRKDRGKIVGVYCVAITPEQRFLTEIMTYDECMQVKKVSKMSAYGPWKEWEEEMLKKTVVKRASKLWPKNDNRQLEKVISHINETEGIEFKETPLPVDHDIAKAHNERKLLVATVKELLDIGMENLTTTSDRFKFVCDYLKVKDYDQIKSLDIKSLDESKKKLEEYIKRRNEDEKKFEKENTRGPSFFV